MCSSWSWMYECYLFFHVAYIGVLTRALAWPPFWSEKVLKCNVKKMLCQILNTFENVYLKCTSGFSIFQISKYATSHVDENPLNFLTRLLVLADGAGTQQTVVLFSIQSGIIGISLGNVALQIITIRTGLTGDAERTLLVKVNWWRCTLSLVS